MMTTCLLVQVMSVKQACKAKSSRGYTLVPTWVFSCNEHTNAPLSAACSSTVNDGVAGSDEEKRDFNSSGCRWCCFFDFPMLQHARSTAQLVQDTSARITAVVNALAHAVL